MTPKDRFLNACAGKPVDRPPVWMMRQAGRYLPEYRAIRDRYSTLDMMKTPALAAEITLQPLRALGVDAAILYSDILMIPDAMGLGLDFKEGIGPVFRGPICSEADIARLETDGILDRLSFVMEGIRLVKSGLPADYPFIGFAGGPFTVASYMVSDLRKMMTERPAWVQTLLEKISRATIDYLTAQVRAGVDVIQLFDTWAGTLSREDYVRWAFPYEKEVIASLWALSAPTILYLKGTAPLFEAMIGVGSDVISIDCDFALSEARRQSRGQVALQGNLDSKILLAPIETIRRETRRMLSEAQGLPGYIANLGHGILPETPVAHARAFVETVQGLTLK